MISIEEFGKVELRVATVTAAEAPPQRRPLSRAQR